MTITQQMLKRTLTINVENGVTASGNPKTKAHSYSGVKKEAADENLHTAGEALAGLMKKSLQSINISQKAELTEAM